MRRFALYLSLALMAAPRAWAAFGSEAASFLNIPVGAAPASLGGAYTALATDAYAPTYNPGGLGFVPSTQLSGQHLSYLESINYEYASFVHPLTSASGRSYGTLGAAIQYFSPGDITARDDTGLAIGDFSGYYAAYALSYGVAVTDRLGVGVSGKLIRAKIDTVTGSAYATDIGTYYKILPSWSAAATVTNLGSHLTLLRDGQPLPTAFHLGTAASPFSHWTFTVEGTFPTKAAASLQSGVQWQPVDLLQLRAGYRTDTISHNSAEAGVSVGAGLRFWGQDLAYAWLPYGDLGSTQYFSFLFRFGAGASEERKMIQPTSLLSEDILSADKGWSL